MNYLANGLSGSDFGPTTQQREVHAQFKEQLSAHRKRLDELMSKGIVKGSRLKDVAVAKPAR